MTNDVKVFVLLAYVCLSSTLGRCHIILYKKIE